MKHGMIPSKYALTVPVVYIDPIILLNKDGLPDSHAARVLSDLWRNYNVNIRYLHVSKHPYKTLDEAEELARETLLPFMDKQFIFEIVNEQDLIAKVSPSTIALFFGEKGLLPAYYKIYGKDNLFEYATLLSAQKTSSGTQAGVKKYKRRRGDIG